MKIFRLFGFISLMALIGFAIFACKEPIGLPNNDTTGSITGKALFNNSDNHTGITITLEKTDGCKYQVTQAQYKAVMGTNPSLYKPARGYPHQQKEKYRKGVL